MDQHLSSVLNPSASWSIGLPIMMIHNILGSIGASNQSTVVLQLYPNVSDG